MKIVFLVLACLTTTLVFGEEKQVFFISDEKMEQTTTVEALNANYDGEKIYLTGDVTIVNPMGEAKAQSAILKKEDQKIHKIDFPFVELKKDVSVKLADGGLLVCDEMTVDL